MTRVGPRDLGGLSMYWRAHGREDVALAFGNDPRRGRRGRDGLRPVRTDRSASANFRPVLLAGLGMWAELAGEVKRWEREGWQLREWMSPTYTARCLTAFLVGGQLATRRRDRIVLMRAVRQWCDLLALISVPAKRGLRNGLYGGVPIQARVDGLHTCPTGMRANRWCALGNGAAEILGVLIEMPGARRRARGRCRHRTNRRPMPDDPARHLKPIEDRCVDSVLALGRSPLSPPHREQLRATVMGNRNQVRLTAKRVETGFLLPMAALRCRIQRRGEVVQVAIDRVTSRLKGAVTAARVTPDDVRIQAVSPLRSNSPKPRVTWDESCCRARCTLTGREDGMAWLDRPDVDLTLSGAAK